jgi:hypothetical protein
MSSSYGIGAVDARVRRNPFSRVVELAMLQAHLRIKGEVVNRR